VLVQADMRTDVESTRVPRITVYRDGTILLLVEWDAVFRPRVARLTPAGIDALEQLIIDAGFLHLASDVPIDTTYAGGFGNFRLALRSGGKLLVRGTTNTPASGHEAEAEAIITLVERVIDIERALPAAAWAVPIASSEPYVAAKLAFKVTIFDNPIGPGSPNYFAADVADIPWPFTTPLLGFGDEIVDPPLESGTTSRCVIVTLTDAAVIVEAIPPADWIGRIPTSERMEATLRWDGGHAHVVVSLAGMLPGEPDDCSLDGNWP
jgi:hypothetical protein